MYFNDGGEQLKESDSEREYFVAAEVFISNAASANLRKVGPCFLNEHRLKCHHHPVQETKRRIPSERCVLVLISPTGTHYNSTSIRPPWLVGPREGTCGVRALAAGYL